MLLNPIACVWISGGSPCEDNTIYRLLLTVPENVSSDEGEIDNCLPLDERLRRFEAINSNLFPKTHHPDAVSF